MSGLLSERQKTRLFQILIPIVFAVVVPLVAGLLIFRLAWEGREREKVIGWLNGVTEPYSVYVDGRPAGNPAVILSTLKGVHDVMSHHSHPTVPFTVEVKTKGGSLKLLLAQDSERTREYWVFPFSEGARQDIDQAFEIGRIETTAPFGT